MTVHKDLFILPIDYTIIIFFYLQQETAVKTKEQHVKADVSELSKRQKQEVFKNESPELFDLVEDLKCKFFIILYVT